MVHLYSCRVFLIWKFLVTIFLLFQNDTINANLSPHVYSLDPYNDNERELIKEEKKYVKRRRKLEIRWGLDVDVSIFFQFSFRCDGSVYHAVISHSNAT